MSESFNSKSIYFEVNNQMEWTEVSDLLKLWLDALFARFFSKGSNKLRLYLPKAIGDLLTGSYALTCYQGIRLRNGSITSSFFSKGPKRDGLSGFWSVSLTWVVSFCTSILSTSWLSLTVYATLKKSRFPSVFFVHLFYSFCNFSSLTLKIRKLPMSLPLHSVCWR